jgi:hypothetical protein
MRLMSHTMAVAIASVQFASAQTIVEQKIMASDGEPGEWFGSAVALEESTIVVGARQDNDNGPGSGSAYVFVKDSTGWIEQAKLIASDGSDDERFGRSVSLSGDYAIAGAYRDNNDAGSAYIYKRNGTTWTEQVKITASDGIAGDYFGLAVGLSGDYAVIGAFGDDVAGDSSGSAYIFVRSDTTWVEQAKLIPSDGFIDDRFGRSVAISGDYAIVGAYGDDVGGGASGSAYVFERSGTVWSEVRKLTASDGTSGAHFGLAVAISGDYLLVGAHSAGADSSGAAYVFKRDSVLGWVETAKLTASDPGAGNEFGISVGITPGFAMIGAWLDTVNGDSSGSAYIFAETGSTWTEYVKIVPSDGRNRDQFGRDVAISTTDAVAGALLSDGMVSRAGAAYIYKDILLAVEDGGQPAVPSAFDLNQNYPNPFNPSTVITYGLRNNTHVELTVHDLLGRKVRTLVNDNQGAGEHEVIWNGTNGSGESVAGGVYLYRLNAGSTIQTRKMVLLK